MQTVSVRLWVVLAVAAVVACNSPTNADCTGRRDTPWCKMSDWELGMFVDKAGGHVFIGFKDPAAAAGVDETGHVLVSDSVVAGGKAWLRSVGVVIEFEYTYAPAVEALMPTRLLRQVRHNPVVEYVEPIFPATYLQKIRGGT